MEDEDTISFGPACVPEQRRKNRKEDTIEDMTKHESCRRSTFLLSPFLNKKKNNNRGGRGVNGLSPCQPYQPTKNWGTGGKWRRLLKLLMIFLSAFRTASETGTHAERFNVEKRNSRSNSSRI